MWRSVSGLLWSSMAPSLPEPSAGQTADTPGIGRRACVGPADWRRWRWTCTPSGRRVMLTLTENASTIVNDITPQPGLADTAGLRITCRARPRSPTFAVSAAEAPSPATRSSSRTARPSTSTPVAAAAARRQGARRRGRPSREGRVRARPPGGPDPGPGAGRIDGSCPTTAREIHLASRPSGLADPRELPDRRGRPARPRAGRGAGAQHLHVGRPVHAGPDERREVLRPAVPARRAAGRRRGRRGASRRATPAVAVGDTVLHQAGWREHALLPASAVRARGRQQVAGLGVPRRRSACPGSRRTSG